MGIMTQGGSRPRRARVPAALLALAVGIAGGCAADPARPSPGPDAARAAAPGPAEPTGEQLVSLDVALIERPAGDRFLNRELWDHGDEQGIALELKPLLEANGLRICQIGGLLPATLQGLLASKRSCPDPRRQYAEADKPTLLPIGPVRERLAFRFTTPTQAQPFDLQQASCQLEVVPHVEDDAHVSLHFTPVVRHGNARVVPLVEKDPDGPLRLTMEARAPVERFPQLSWDCTVAVNELVVLGARLDRPGTLGHACFLPDDQPKPTQWLLVLRACRVPLGHGVDETLTQAPPLAMQAASTGPGEP
jgi:hypothetical protein